MKNKNRPAALFAHFSLFEVCAVQYPLWFAAVGATVYNGEAGVFVCALGANEGCLKIDFFARRAFVLAASAFATVNVFILLLLCSDWGRKGILAEP
jgi:hypothetical protein